MQNNMKVKKNSRTYIIANIKEDKLLDDYAFVCKNLFNSTLYQYRQRFFSNLELISDYDMFDVMKSFDSPIPAKVKQQVITQVYQSVKSFYSKKDSKKKLPRYLDSQTGRANIILTNQAISRKQFNKKHKIAFNYQGHTFQFDIAKLKQKLNLTFDQINQVRVVYKKSFKSYQVILIVIPESKQQPKQQNKSIMAIDLGLDRIMAAVFKKQKVLFDGKQLKKINHRFNKNLAKLQSERDLLKNQLIKLQCQFEKMDYDAIFYYELSMEFDFNEEKYKKLIRKQLHITNRLHKLDLLIAKLYEKRNNRIKYCLHKLSRDLIELSVSNGIGKIVIGYNKEWKQAINIGKRNNQNFVQIPFKTLIDYITYKANDYNIEVITQEESYTSKCSFLDDESVRKHKTYAGRRVNRGLYRSANGQEIHADINAAYNIAKKAGFNFAQAKLESLSPCSWAVVKRISFN